VDKWDEKAAELLPCYCGKLAYEDKRGRVWHAWNCPAQARFEVAGEFRRMATDGALVRDLRAEIERLRWVAATRR